MPRSIIECPTAEEQHTDPNHALRDLLEHVRRLLEGLPAPRLEHFRVHWPSSAQVRAVARVGRPRLPVLDFLPMFAADDDPCGNVATALQRAAPSLVWQQSYATPEVSGRFLCNYAWTEILGIDAPVLGEQLACGFLLLGPDTLYPAHRHEAEEAYVPLSGGARWRQGDDLWREHPPCSVILHASGEPHAMHTGAQGLLALYLWRSDNLRQKARLDPPTP